MSKKKTKSTTTLNGWIAREDYEVNHNRLLLFSKRPRRNGTFGWDGHLLSILDTYAFPEVEWTDEPVEVEIIIKK